MLRYVIVYNIYNTRFHNLLSTFRLRARPALLDPSFARYGNQQEQEEKEQKAAAASSRS